MATQQAIEKVPKAALEYLAAELVSETISFAGHSSKSEEEWVQDALDEARYYTPAADPVAALPGKWREEAVREKQESDSYAYAEQNNEAGECFGASRMAQKCAAELEAAMKGEQ